MLEIVLSNQFKKDLKAAQKRGKELAKLKKVIETLQKEEPLPEKNKDHSLTGKYKDFHECHIEPDWLLIYRIEHDSLLLFLMRTGTHSDLF
ncbi:MAG: type II toxin-antitoxin system YafQ family toxin [Bacilli bacterium]|nr:type II toxin-antitoxin system YafQ family toxin [Bacilli bacterium]